jgi:NAD(P)-dependent dehydrogenase (short-subunit alcohol dehydrogenase family)
MQVASSVVLISGASSGLGWACVRRVLDLGGKVVGLDRAPPSSLLSHSDLENYLHFSVDVTNKESVEVAIANGKSTFGKLNAAVCCAGVLHGERIVGREGAASLEAFQRVMDVNVNGTFNVVRLAAETMAKGDVIDPDGGRGVIIMTSSIAAFDGQIGQAAYAASKGAVASMTLPIARELGRFGIRVVSIAPGVFDTPMMLAASERVRQPLLEQTIFPKRFGLPEEFAALVQHVFENRMMNGTVLRLDAALRM